MTVLETNFEVGLEKDPKASFQDYFNQVEKMVFQAKDYDVCSMWSMEEALSFSLEARSLYKKIEQARKELTEPARRFANRVNDSAKVFTEKLKEIEKIIQFKVDDWKKKTATLHEMKREELELLAEAMDLSTSDIVHNQLTTVRVQGGVAYEKTDWIYTVENLSIVPREFLRLDEDKVKQAIKSGVREIPGLQVQEETKTIVRPR
jgi:hypothetical protein